MNEVVCEAVLEASEPLAAAAEFHARLLPEIERLVAGGARVVTVRFRYADPKPHGWRNAAIAALARAHAPARVNGVAPADGGGDEAKMARTIAFLFANEGVTGQLLLVG